MQVQEWEGGWWKELLLALLMVLLGLNPGCRQALVPHSFLGYGEKT